MNSPIRTLRFRPSGNADLSRPGSRVLLDVILNEAPAPVGYVIQQDAVQGAPLRWSYVLRNGQATGLQTTLSRRELESQIRDHYFHEYVTDQRHSA